jgi:hypothetical protein
MIAYMNTVAEIFEDAEKYKAEVKGIGIEVWRQS